MRSWIFVPGHSAKMLEKSFGLPVDVVMLDLEDGVVPAMKGEARALVAEALDRHPDVERPCRYVRVNAVGTSELALDLASIVRPALQGLVVPKVETVDQVSDLDAHLGQIESDKAIPRGQIKLMLAIESARGLVAAPTLVTASSRVSGLMFGAEDFSRDLGLATVRTGLAREFTYARSAIVVAAAAARVQSIDGVWPDLKDAAGLEDDCVRARALGFSGKSMIHPGQAEAINRIFRPSNDEIEYARRLINEFEQAVAAGHGSISFGGMLVDRPIYERARATVGFGES